MENWFQDELNQTALESVLNITEKGVNVRFGVVYGEEESTVDRLVMYVKGFKSILINKKIYLHKQLLRLTLYC